MAGRALAGVRGVGAGWVRPCGVPGQRCNVGHIRPVPLSGAVWPKFTRPNHNNLYATRHCLIATPKNGMSTASRGSAGGRAAVASRPIRPRQICAARRELHADTRGDAGRSVMLVLAVRCSARAMTTGSGITINAVRKAVSLGARSRSSMIQEHMQRLRYGTRAHSPQ